MASRETSCAKVEDNDDTRNTVSDRTTEDFVRAEMIAGGAGGG